MKKIVLTMFLVCVSALCLANPVSEKKAHQVAFNFLNKKTNTSYDEIKLVYSQRFPIGEDTAYYVYSSGNSSFVIVAGDDIAKPIWGIPLITDLEKKCQKTSKSYPMEPIQ
ncbi:MAG: Spi family protease inhibitor [Bacteroidales bacterium]|nr:Spi family protease inhibitor [Bacteroidales bacterium]